MSEQTLMLANQAIFHLQLNTQDAQRHVSRLGKVNAETAALAIKQTLGVHKPKK